MKKKRFIKLMRAAGFSERIINAFCFAVKESGGRVDYRTLYTVVSKYSKKSWEYWATVLYGSMGVRI